MLPYFCWLTFVPFSCWFYFSYFVFFNLTPVIDWLQTEREAQRRVGLTSWIFQSCFSWNWRPASWSYAELLMYWEILPNGLCNGSLRTLWKITCGDMEHWPRLVPGLNLQEEYVHPVATFVLNSFVKAAVNIRTWRRVHQLPNQRETSQSLLSISFSSLSFLCLFSLSCSLYALCRLSPLPLPVPYLSPTPSSLYPPQCKEVW